ncbi:UDP-N-acetylmuramoyl-tripeptide--D-alanyl-D-alanine ligase [Candidatus Halobeggiatoa sp. HSG11]|nr:UDP-N-acetylmuramoyl-tripeptide--D-alanyl-D-alanine ligase [Candidatus Halobeggiatoa sp. HSG11]
MFTLTEIAPALNATLNGADIKFTSCSIDTRQLQPGAIYIALAGENFDGHDFVQQAQDKGAVAAIISHDVKTNLPTLRVHDTRKALGKLAYLWRQRFDLPIIAITGSNGKTTTKEMLKAILSQHSVLATKGNLNNEIGVPLTLFNLNSEHHYAVVEMGANHMGEIATLTKIAQPTCAIITQCAPAHLEGFGSIEGVAKAKGEIFTHLPSDGVAIINNDDVYAKLWHDLAISHQIKTYGLNNQADVSAKNISLQDDSSYFILQTPSGEIAINLPLPGQHNIMNALAASSAALVNNCTLQTIQQGLQSMQPVVGRLQIIKGKITLINDTYNANPTSLKAALQVLNNMTSPHWLILGDMGELGTDSVEFHRQAGQLAKEFEVEKLWTIGDMSHHATTYFGDKGKHFTNHDDLVQSMLTQLPSSATLLIKGSRSMQMEKIVQALQEGI